jgi:hypothetical protein
MWPTSEWDQQNEDIRYVIKIFERYTYFIGIIDWAVN